MSQARLSISPVLPRERRNFDGDWLFRRGDPDGLGHDTSNPGEDRGSDVCAKHLQNTRRATVGEGATPASVLRGAVDSGPMASEPYARPEFDDTDWRRLDLPHDWGIEGPFSIDLPGETGKLPWQGVGWYRKHFAVTDPSRDSEVYLELDGAMSFSTIWLNGIKIGGWPYGYTAFRVELTPWLRASGDNVLAIRLDNPPNSSRWYPGAGLYRHVWLSLVPKVRVAHDGVFVHCPHVRESEAVVNVDVVLHNSLPTDVEVQLTTVIQRLDDSDVADSEYVSGPSAATCKLGAANQTQRTLCHRIPEPSLWTLTNRARYRAVVRVEHEGRVVDEVACAFGIRTATFDVAQGFLLNGKRVPIQGVCLHHDLGALGTAVNRRALERQIEILQSMGCNAIRTSHNPPAKELLDLCDQMGMLLMVEAFDCWRRGKKSPEGLAEGDAGFHYFDYAAVYDDWHDADLRSMVRKSRNHPSVICYSVGNEVIEQWYADGWKDAVHLAGIVREEDRTRAITAGCNGEIAAYRGFQTALDLIGLNYKPGYYGQLRQDNPTLKLIGTETASTISTRGEYYFPFSDDKASGQVDFQVSSYDRSAPPWAFTPDDEFRGLDENPFVAGEFVWTGFDYLGEPTPYNSDSTNLLNFSDPEQRAQAKAELDRLGRIAVPSRSSYFGIIDLAGFPKDRFYIYQARWRPDFPMAHILPHWNWPERLGQVTPVHVYSNGDEAELFANGRSLGRRSRKTFDYRFRWDDVTYEPGELKVVTFRRGQQWATATRRTTGAAVRLHAQADRSRLRVGECDLAFVTVRVQDEDGEVVPRSRALVHCRVDGPASIVATDNGDPTSLESFQSPHKSTHQGLLLVVLRAHRTGSGPVTLHLQSDGLGSCEVRLEVIA